MTTTRSLADYLADSPFQAYVYSYPHKTAYRPLNPPVRLEQAWAAEDRSSLFLYLHVPFCEQRCGFCNLFTQSQPQEDTVEVYLDALERQAAVVAQQVQPGAIARMAVGGGTPSFLTATQLERLFAIATSVGGHGVPCSVEVSPSTVSADRIDVLRRQGVTRVSMGVQSTRLSETSTLRRHQDPGQAQAALGHLRDAGFATVNADLIYGHDGQSAESLIASIDDVLSWGANELYLYPLYVRPLTTLGRLGEKPSTTQIQLYQVARDYLRSRGWSQLSLRLFRPGTVPPEEAPPYRCQDDGMIGLGPGARSYTRSLHYASGYAVSQAAVKTHIGQWSAQTSDDFSWIHHGIHLDQEDQQRRFAILSLLESGIDDAAYQCRFGSTVEADMMELGEGIEAGLILHEHGRWTLTDDGVERSDVLGRWLFSRRVVELMGGWAPS